MPCMKMVRRAGPEGLTPVWRIENRVSDRFLSCGSSSGLHRVAPWSGPYR